MATDGVREELQRLSKKFQRESRDAIREHIAEMGFDGWMLRTQSLIEQVDEAEERTFQLKQQWRVAGDKRDSTALRVLAKAVKLKEAQCTKLWRELDYVTSVMLEATKRTGHKQPEISEFDIDRARAYPLDQLVEIRRGMARCVGGTHDDKNPSMDVRNNFAYCYACGWSGDAIDVYRKKTGAEFVDAVKALR